MTTHRREFQSLLRSIATHQHPYQVFRDFCEMAAISLSNVADLLQRDSREARYLEIVRQYQPQQVQQFPKMLGCVTDALEESYCDFLGETYMDMEFGNPAAGQFFTPYPIAKMMAMMNTPALPMADGKPHFTVMEPAVGSGVMVIAMADVLRSQHINYQQCMHVTAIDVDALAVHMAYIQLTLLHIPAIVIHGNALSMETFGHWITLSHVMGHWDYRLKQQDNADTIHQVPMIPTDSLPSHHIANERASIINSRTEQLALF